MKKRHLFWLAPILFFASLFIFPSVRVYTASTITKSLLGANDIHWWDGVDSTFQRVSSAGGYNLTLQSFGNEVDAVMAYGGGVNFNNATITSALTAIGTTNKCTLVLRPGTWTVSANVDWSSYTNVTFKVVPGATFSHSTYTMNVPNLVAEQVQVFSGTGAITLSGTVPVVHSIWFATLQSAITATPAGSKLFITQAYTITAALTVTNSITIDGLPGISNITQNTTTADTLQINTTGKVVIQNISFTRGGTPTAGAGIRFTGSGGVQVDRPRVFNCIFSNSWIGIAVDAANQFQIWACDFLNGRYEILVTDTASNDSEIIGNFFNTSVSGAALCGIQIEAAPGMRIANNKILGYGYGIQFNLKGDTSSFNITGNSIENQATAAIQFQQAVAAKTIGSVAITGNEISQSPIGIEVGATTGAWFQNVAITGNTISNFTTGMTFGSGDSIVISGNQLYSGTSGIVATLGATNVHESGNSIVGCTTARSGSFNSYGTSAFTVNHQSVAPADSVYWKGRIESGKANLVFSNEANKSVDITFATAFSAVPLFIVATQSTGLLKDLVVRTGQQGLTGFTIYGRTYNDDLITGTEVIDWFAIGVD